MTIWCECKHGGKMGWRREGGWFQVHHACHLPAKAFVLNFLQGEQNVEGTTVNLFRYGPHHNEVWTNEQLLYPNAELASAAWIVDYAWTQETVRGSESGRLARVWVHAEEWRKEAEQKGVHGA